MHPGIRARLAASTLLLAAIPLAPCVAQDDRPAENKNERRPGQGRLLENSPRPNQSEQDGPGRNRPGQLRPQDGRPGGPPNPEMAARGMAMMMRNFPIFKALDTDEDGQLSQSEIENASKSILKLDKNGDGIVSPEEMRPDPSQMPMFANGGGGPGGPNGGAPGAGMAGNPQMMMRMFENRDENKDGKLAGDEIPPMMRDRLRDIDTNGDGAIDKSEIEQAIRRLENMRPGNRRPEGRQTEGGQGVAPRRPPSDT